MSRILDAMRKVEAEKRSASEALPSAPEPRRRRAREPELRVSPSEPAPAVRAASEAAVEHGEAEPPVAEEMPASPIGEAPVREPHGEPAGPDEEPAGSEAPPLPGLPEDFRRELSGLRIQVDAALSGRRPRVLMLASSTQGEGTTTVAGSLARVLALDESVRVLLVDAQVQRPGVGGFFGIPEGPGLPAMLEHRTAIDEELRWVERPNLHVLPAQPLAESGRGFTKAALREFLQRYGPYYDYMLFDAPPVLESPETPVLGGVVDTTLLVVQAAATKSGVVGRAVDALAKAGVPVLGVVLNRRRLDIPEFIYKRI